jgi:hypothetical protein
MNSQFLDLSVVVVGRPQLDIIPAGPGRLLSKAYLAGGHVMEKNFNRLAHKIGLGPDAVAKRISDRFEFKPEGTVIRLTELDSLSAANYELEKDCLKLMKHALPYVFPPIYLPK